MHSEVNALAGQCTWRPMHLQARKGLQLGITGRVMRAGKHILAGFGSDTHASREHGAQSRPMSDEKQDPTLKARQCQCLTALVYGKQNRRLRLSFPRLLQSEGWLQNEGRLQSEGGCIRFSKPLKP
eukprot:1161161-Pelagomonas_calceolata.AAC.4